MFFSPRVDFPERGVTDPYGGMNHIIEWGFEHAMHLCIRGEADHLLYVEQEWREVNHLPSLR